MQDHYIWAGDEAGLGPVIGSLAMVQVHLSGDSQELRNYNVKDSKELHRQQDLKPLETVALSALAEFGWQPSTVAELFSMVRCDDMMLQQAPWFEHISQIELPLQASLEDIAPWGLTACRLINWSGDMVSAHQITQAQQQGMNRQQLQISRWQPHWRNILSQAPINHSNHGSKPTYQLIVDRLGGRKFYQEALQETWPGTPVHIVSEGPGASNYQLSLPAPASQENMRHNRDLNITFQVKADRDEPAVALASILAKYLRELEMHCINSYWTGRMRWLKRTAGYPQDGKRWWQIGGGNQIGHWW